MSYLIDDVARTLASPMPRRKAFGKMAALLGGVFLATVIPVRADSNNCTPVTECTSSGNKCHSSHTCMSCGGVNLCCNTGFVCCGMTCCSRAACCDTAAGVCFTSNQGGSACSACS
jgi:hypothetical protein